MSGQEMKGQEMKGHRMQLMALLLAVAGPLAAQAPPAPTSVPAELAKMGVQRFVFEDWAGPAVPVWYLRPAGAAADAPILFVMHGVGRDADRYIAEWVDIAKASGVHIVVPEFTAAGFPKAVAYNHGGLFDATGKPQPRETWAFSAIEPIFDAVRKRETLSANRYHLYGHSAGAQFVHRFVLTGGGARMQQAISANAGSYAMPIATVSWPYGMGKLPAGVWDPARAFQAPMVLLLGTADNDPAHKSLPDQPEAKAQGPNRLARGLAFRETAVQQAGPALAWGCALAPGVGHDNGRMAPFAMALVKGKAALVAGAPCADILPIGP